MTAVDLNWIALLQVGDVLSQCSAIVLKAGEENQYEKEGYGQRPYDNWETIMFSCQGKVCSKINSSDYMLWHNNCSECCWRWQHGNSGKAVQQPLASGGMWSGAFLISTVQLAGRINEHASAAHMVEHEWQRCCGNTTRNKALPMAAARAAARQYHDLLVSACGLIMRRTGMHYKSSRPL
eukprot:GHRR01025045.1.p1 GENE.GHRR01025045.1~~GHRR01025045.1.p1  ORF type:complete len:180 (-),score=35.20 GHRR01025045.1:374-913(-)